MPHGDWKKDLEFSALEANLGVSYVSKKMPATTIDFHCSGNARKIWTMYLGHVADCPKLLAVVGHKIPQQDALWYDDFALGHDFSKNILAVYLSS